MTQLPSVNSVTFPLLPLKPVLTSWLASLEVCFLLIRLELLSLILYPDPSGIYGALANLQMLVNAGKISPSDISNMPAAVQRVIANLAVA
jgi:hypothetical protein